MSLNYTFFAENRVQALSIVSFLQENDIPVFQDEVRLIGYFGEHHKTGASRIYVPNDYKEEASEIIRNFQNAYEKENKNTSKEIKKASLVNQCLFIAVIIFIALTLFYYP